MSEDVRSAGSPGPQNPAWTRAGWRPGVLLLLIRGRLAAIARQRRVVGR